MSPEFLWGFPYTFNTPLGAQCISDQPVIVTTPSCCSNPRSVTQSCQTNNPPLGSPPGQRDVRTDQRHLRCSVGVSVPWQAGPYLPGVHSSQAVPMKASVQLHRPDPLILSAQVPRLRQGASSPPGQTENTEPQQVTQTRDWARKGSCSSWRQGNPSEKPGCC